MKTLVKKDKKYISFWEQFGRPIKEGVYQDYENKEDLLELIRFKSIKAEGYTVQVELEMVRSTVHEAS